MVPILPFHNADPVHTEYQYLEDLSTAYWFSEVLFAAIELQLFTVIEKENPETDRLSHILFCKKDELFRFLKVLNRMGLLDFVDCKWQNSQAAKKYLVLGRSSYMGDFFLYRKY